MFKKHRETEATEKSSEQFQTHPQFPGKGRGTWKHDHKLYVPCDRLANLVAESVHTSSKP
jgi:hypothetical protein